MMPFNPLDLTRYERTHYIVEQELCDKHLDYHAHREAFSAMADPLMYMTCLNRLSCKSDANSNILATNNIIAIRPSDARTDFVYSVLDERDWNAVISFGDNCINREYADKHPDVEEGNSNKLDRTSIEQGKFDSRCHAPITTTASKYLFSVVLTPARGNSHGRAAEGNIVQMHAAYRHQLSLRISEDCGSPSLNLDCFEYVPTCLDLDSPHPPIPTIGELNRFYNVVSGSSNKAENFDEFDDEIAEVCPGIDMEVANLNYKAFVGRFLTSRCFRLRIALSDVRGARLMAAPTARRAHPPEGDNDVGAVLILETATPPREGRDFAVRTVRSKRADNADAFAPCPDWLPGVDTGSRATRFYFYGNLEELKHTAAMMAGLRPDLARMLGGSGPNALGPGASVEYGAAPSRGKRVKSGKVGASNTIIDPPPPSSWKGMVPKAREVFESVLARETNPMKRMVMRMMSDPESVIAINQDPNSSPEDRMLSNLVGQHVLRNQGMDEMLNQVIDAGERGEECSIM